MTMNDEIMGRLDRLESDFKEYKKSQDLPRQSPEEMEKFISDWVEKQLRPGGMLHK